ncbi:MAG: FAD:protein FMN transferase [Caldilinea sp.]|nr:FAD:protein FMN transferase [Caldilinea sp.]
MTEQSFSAGLGTGLGAALTPSAGHWQQRCFRAMNTAVEVVAYHDGEDVTAAIEALFHQAEQRMSRFLPDSELSRLNAADAPQTVSPDLFAVIETALWAAQQTGGLYDPTILADLEAAGYDRSFEYVVTRNGFSWSAPADAPGAAGRRRTSYADIMLDRNAGVVVKPAGVRLDLGGIGKGWTVDRAAERLLGAAAFLVNAGGDLYAYGRPGHPRGWRITIEHPLRRTHWIARLYIDHAGLATSTTMKRRWTVDGQHRHHLIDPRTGQPAITDALSVTVVAPRTVTAELLAKVALLLGADAGLAYLTATDGVEGLIYTTDGRVLTTPGLASVLDAVEPAGIAD